MKTLHIVLACLLTSGALSAQTWLPQSLDQSLQPGATTLGTVTVGARAASACDDFNRPNSTNMGADWTEVSGDQQILGNQAANLGTANSWMLHTSAAAPYAGAKVEFDLDPNAGGASAYGAAVIGYNPATGEDIYVKVQNQSGLPGYSNYGFYHGFNGGGYSGWGGFGSLPYQSPGGHVTVSVDAAGDTVTLDIDENYDGVPEITLTAPGLIASGLPALLSDQYGAGFWSAGVMDNWELNGGCAPSGPTLALTTACPGPVGISVTGITPGGSFAWIAGTTAIFLPTIPVGACTGTLALVNFNGLPGGPYWGIKTADAGGNYTGVIGSVGPAACGLVKLEVIDGTTCAQSNVVTL